MDDRINPCSVCLTLDFDSFSCWIHAFGLNTPTHMSKGEFGARVGVPRILKLLAKYGIKATFYVPGHTVDSWPKVVEEIAAAGHEIGHHGYAHESPVSLSRDQEKRNLERGMASIRRVLGKEPVGYRSPSWDLSAHSLELFKEFGFEYDSSLMGHDFELYWCRIGDVPHADKGYEFGRETEIVEVPVSWSLDDFPQFEFLYLNQTVLPGLSAPSKVLESWSADFDYMYRNVENGVFTLTCHPQFIARGGGRLMMLEKLIHHIRGYAGVEFKRVQDVVAAFKASHKPGG
jgi:peptidoglycan/xylan/chitin deacetylase (PgdA/CDA1 family)